MNFTFQHLSNKRQEAERFFSDDLGSNEAISTDEKNRWLATHQELVDQIFVWIEKVLNGADTEVDIARLKAKRDNLIKQSNQHLWARIHKANKKGKDGQGKEITKDEANVQARQLINGTPTWDWTCRKLKKQIGCPLAWIPYLPVWRAYHEKRKELRRNKTIDTVPLSKELEAVLGEGEKDEVLKQLIAEQEGEQREDARQAKLYLSHKKKPDQGRG